MLSLEEIIKTFIGVIGAGLIIRAYTWWKSLRREKALVIKERRDLEIEKIETKHLDSSIDELIHEDNSWLRALRDSKNRKGK